MKCPDDDDYRLTYQVGDFPPTKSAALHTQQVQFLRIRRGERPEKTSQYLGVSRDSKPPHRWRAKITNREANLDKVSLGAFATEELAARAYDIISLASHGAEGTTNFPKDDYRRMNPKWATAMVAEFASGDLAEARKALAKAAQITVDQVAKGDAVESD